MRINDIQLVLVFAAGRSIFLETFRNNFQAKTTMVSLINKTVTSVQVQ